MTSFFATPPVEVIVTTITTDGWSSSTSTWRTVAVSSPGAETSASSRVTWLSISVVDWSAASTSLRIEVRSSGKRGGPRLLALEHLLGVEAVAGFGRDPAGRGVRMREQAERLELGELAADGRRRDAEAGALDERLRADRLAGGDVLLDDPPKDVALALADLGHLQVKSSSRRAARP